MPFLLPSAPADDSVCVVLSIPNTEQDIANFLGQLYELGQVYNYDRGDNYLRNAVARSWWDAPNSVVVNGCTMIRQNTIDPCKLEQSFDGGETWSEWADITQCVNADYISSVISGNQALRDTIAYISQGSSSNNSSTEQPTSLFAQLIGGQAGCTNDHVYGMVVQFVDFLNSLSEDIVQIVSNNASIAGRLGDAIEAIPAIGELPFDDAFQLVESVLEDWQEGYDASYTETIRQELICDLYCIAAENCELTMEAARNYFLSKLIGFVTFTVQLDFWQSVNVYSWAGTASIYGLHLAILQAMIFGGEIAGQNTNKIVQIVQAFFNDPDSDWETLCDECPSGADWSYYVDFRGADTLANSQWFHRPQRWPYPQYNATAPTQNSNGLVGQENPDQGAKIINLQLNHTGTLTYFRARGYIQATRSAFANYDSWIRLYEDGGERAILRIQPNSAGSLMEVEWTPASPVSFSNLGVNLLGAINNGTNDGIVHLYDILVEGNNPNPIT